MDTYNSILIDYALYEENIKLKNNECYNDRVNNINNNKKCDDNNINKKISDRFNVNSKLNEDDCKKNMLMNNIFNNSNSKKNIISNKNNKILTKRIINTIPYRNYKNFDYNPELELYIKNNNYNGNSKSTNNTSEIKNKKYPLNNNIKGIFNSRNNVIDLDRFNLSTRQLKGDNNYKKLYKKQLKKLSKLLN